jgi:hypothetical protein
MRTLPDAHRLNWKVGESSEWNSIANAAEDEGEQSKLLQNSRWEAGCSLLYGMYTVTLNKLRAILKMSVQAGQSGVVNKSSVESTAQDDDFRGVKRSKSQISMMPHRQLRSQLN